MEIKFIITKEERKALVKAVSEITGQASVYQGAPGFAFAVGDYIIDRHGTLIYDEHTDEAEVKRLLSELSEQGFIRDWYNEPDSLSDSEATTSDDLTNREVIPANGDGESFDQSSGGDNNSFGEAEPDSVSGKLSVSMPLFGFNPTAHGNLENLVAAKTWIIKKMTGADELPINRDEKYLRFPWFKPESSVAEIDAYSRLVARLCETAKKKQRITATERELADGDNEKFKARCFLLSLGFIGDEYAQARKILLAPMSGNGSFRTGNQKRTDAPSGAIIADSGDNINAVSSVLDGEVTAQTAEKTAAPPKCGECLRHCYYSGGVMQSKTGNVVDTSKRTPDSYTHYCLAAPSGFRKIKHSNDWSGSESPTTWCPGYADSMADNREEALV